MRVVIFASAPHQRQTGEWMREGLERHGIEATFAEPQKPVACDLAIVWGHRWKHIHKRQRLMGRDYLVMERGYFRDRMHFTSLGFNGLNGRADFLKNGADGSRWAKHGLEMQPWHGGSYSLVIGQVPGDASTEHADICAWYELVLEDAPKPIYFRHHPLSGIPGIHAQVLDCPLHEALAGAARVITFNSNTGVDAALAGTPVVAYDRGSMAWAVASHDVGAKDITPDRTRWAHELAWCQWTPDEIQSGEAWAHLKARYK
jgi:hypothetical protein